MEITRKSFFVSAGGGTIDFVRDGEVLASVAVPPGKVRAADYLDLVPEGASIEVADGLAVLTSRHRVGVLAYGPGSHDSGANPDYRPTRATGMELEMRRMVSRLVAKSEKRVEARLAALSKIQRMPDNPAPAPVDPVPVIEPEPAPEVESPQ